MGEGHTPRVVKGRGERSRSAEEQSWEWQSVGMASPVPG